MVLNDICRLCLVTDVRTLGISGGPLQHIYEKLTNVPLHKGDRPVVACYLCHYQLRKSYELMVKSVNADNILTEICQNASILTRESITSIDREAYKLNDVRNRSTLVLLEMDSKSTEGLKIKDELASEDDSAHENIEWESQEEGRDVNIDGLTGLETVNSEESEELNIKEEPLMDFEDTEMLLFEGSENINNENSEGAVPVKKLESIEDILVNLQENMTDQYKNKIEDTPSSTNTPKPRKFKRISKKTAKFQRRHASNSAAKYNCNICGETFNQKYTLLAHIKLHDSNENIANEEHILYNCSICQCDFGQRYELKRHNMETHRGEEIFQSNIDQNGISQISDFNNYINNEKLLYKCSLCPRGFRIWRNLKKHSKTHTAPLQCEICQRGFLQKKHFNNHLKTHTGEKPFKCEICQRAFIQRTNLDNHLKTHTGEKPFKCEICQRGFIQKATLNNHMKTHTGERPFKCEICNRGFIQKPNLDNHLRTHTGEKPFKCGICKRGFIQKRNLQNHLRIHTGEMYLKPEICQQEFTKKAHLNKHSKIHSKDSPLKIIFTHKKSH